MMALNRPDATDLDLAEKAVAAIRRHGSPSYPRAFEVWYAHLSGELPALSFALEQELVSGGGRIDGETIDRLYERFISTSRLAKEADLASAQILDEIARLSSAIGATIDASERYHSEITSVSEDGPSSADRTKMREWVEALVVSTRNEVARKSKLEVRLRESAREIGNLKASLEATRIEAQTDALTSLPNRRHFDEMLQRHLDIATTAGTPLTLIMADIDYFKRFNDQHGHLTGDQVLRLVARTMSDKLASEAVITRYGGEEFAIILPAKSLSEAENRAEAVRQALLTRELVNRSTKEKLGRVTISLGVAAFEFGDTPTSLIERADQALLSAKRSGRNRTVTQDAITPTS
jgi:diguanylate cyclase